VLSRRITALLATAFFLPQAASEECVWPQPEPMTPAPSGDGVAIEGPDELPVQVTSGGAELTRAGDAKLSDGVVVRQGNRELSAESATYDASERRFEVEGDVEFRSPDLRLKSTAGAWGMGGAGHFTGAEFELPAQPARGEAAELDVSPQGTLSLREVSFTTCPAGNNDWFLRASSIDIDQRTQLGKGRSVRVELKGIPILYAPTGSRPEPY
jgi:LPS-assembly protein